MAALREGKERLAAEGQALEEKLGQGPVTAEDVHAVMRHCGRVARNLSAFSVEEKRRALETLQVRVAVEQDRLLLDGVLPLSVASTHSGEGVRSDDASLSASGSGVRFANIGLSEGVRSEPGVGLRRAESPSGRKAKHYSEG